jgi:hypothetical protein
MQNIQNMGLKIPYAKYALPTLLSLLMATGGLLSKQAHSGWHPGAGDHDGHFWFLEISFTRTDY